MAKLESYATFKNMEKEIKRLKEEKDNYLKCIEEIAQYISHTKHGFSFQKKICNFRYYRKTR